MAAPMKFRRGHFLAAVTGFIFIITVYSHGHGHAHEHEHHMHDHDHNHDREPAHFKYSKAANEDADSGVGPGVAKDPHPHSHDGHGHSHEHHQGHDHSHDHDQTPNKKSNSESSTTKNNWMLWGQAIGSTALVSITPVFILIFIPVDHTSSKPQPLLKILLSFASGGLLGDAFLHLIPHAVSSQSGHGHSHDHAHTHSHGHSHDHAHTHSHGHSHGEGEGHGHDMGVGMCVIAGILTFLCVEKFVRIVKGDHGHSHEHGNSHEHKQENSSDKEPASDSDGKKKKKAITKNKKSDKKENESDKGHGSDLKVAGYLNLAADFAHNFTDGLAIGASYLAGQNIGIVTTITILLHEVPHEVGDFAILVQSGASKKRAMMLQFTTAAGAMFGTLVSLMAGGIADAATAWVLPFTAGGFIYIATVSVLPELLVNSSFGQSLKEIVAMIVGIYMMVLIAEYE